MIRPRHAASLLRLLADFRQAEILGAEVGVLQGTCSRILLKHVPNLFLWMVDGWSESPADSAYRHSGDRAAAIPQAEHLSNLEEAFTSTRFAAERRALVRCDSLTAARGMRDESLDFVFIDADHTLEAVQRDIAAWWPKVLAGGILGGHDYGGRKNRLGRWGVNRAVDAFVAERGLRLQQAPGSVWWVRKPAPTIAAVATADVPDACRAGAIVRIVFGKLPANERLQTQIQQAFAERWAREEVLHFVAGTENARWLEAQGAKHVELVAPDGWLPEVERFGPWFMKPYLLGAALDRLEEMLYLDFDAQILKRPDGRMWARLRETRPSNFGRSLLAQNVAYRRPVCLTIHRDRSRHPVRRCLNTGVVYCRDRHWLEEWLAAYTDAERQGVAPSRFHDETFLMHALDKRLGVLEAETMAQEFEIPIARLRRNTPEGRSCKDPQDAYFHHR